MGNANSQQQQRRPNPMRFGREGIVPAATRLRSQVQQNLAESNEHLALARRERALARREAMRLNQLNRIKAVMDGKIHRGERYQLALRNRRLQNSKRNAVVGYKVNRLKEALEGR